MDNVDFCETPLSLYSYGAMPTKQDIPYAGAGLETNTDNGYIWLIITTNSIFY